MQDADATLVTYSTVDRTSFQHAVETLSTLRRQYSLGGAIVLVANKIDLVRIRQVAQQGGLPVYFRHSFFSNEITKFNRKPIEHLIPISKTYR